MKRGYCILLSFVLLATNAKGEDSLAVATLPSPLSCDYQYVKRSDPWLTLQNAASLTRYANRNMAEAELSLTKTEGDFTNFDGSPNTLQAGALIESFFRLSNRTVCYGSMSYQSFDGKDMAGSAFIPVHLSDLSQSSPFSLPSSPFTIHRPFDIVEDSLMNTGDKHLDVYQLTGGVGCELAKVLSVGLRLDYTAANYAKYKDLRHQNKYMDLRFSAGIYMPFAAWGALGAHYTYHRNTETISFGTYGKNEKVYQSLVSYAAFMGHLEQFGSTGFTDKSREMPLVTDEDGFGIQLSISPFTSMRDAATEERIIPLTFFNEFNYSHARGYYGRKSPFTITYTGHKSDKYHYAAQLTSLLRKSRVSLDFSLDIENLKNDMNTYREMKNEQGATYYDYYDPVKMANKVWTDWMLAATIDLGIQKDIPTWTIQAGINHGKRKQTAYAYPYYRHQELNNNRIFASVNRNLFTKNGVWSVSLNGSWQKGAGEPYEDHTFETPSDKQSVPPSMDTYLYREYQYLTSPQFTIGGQVKYAFLFPGTGLKTHARFCVNHRKATKEYDYSDGSHSTFYAIAVGCFF